jgi:hypothetical protein
MKKFVVILLTTSSLAGMGLVAKGSETSLEATRRQFAEDVASKRTRSDRPIKADPAAIAKLIDEINAAIRVNKQRMLSIIVINTDVSAAQLEREKTENGMTFGEVYVAHSLSLATKKKFKAIVALHKSGKSWADIAKSHGVTLKGSSELIKEMQKQ